MKNQVILIFLFQHQIYKIYKLNMEKTIKFCAVHSEQFYTRASNYSLLVM
jgi:hypothetical protein